MHGNRLIRPRMRTEEGTEHNKPTTPHGCVIRSLIDLVARADKISAMSCEFGGKNYTSDIPPNGRGTVLKWDTLTERQSADADRSGWD